MCTSMTLQRSFVSFSIRYFVLLSTKAFSSILYVQQVLRILASGMTTMAGPNDPLMMSLLTTVTRKSMISSFSAEFYHTGTFEGDSAKPDLNTAAILLNQRLADSVVIGEYLDDVAILHETPTFHLLLQPFDQFGILRENLHLEGSNHYRREQVFDLVKHLIRGRININRLVVGIMHVEGEDGWTVIATGKKHILSGNRKKNKTVLAVSQVPYDWTALANHEESLQKSQTVAIASQLLSDLLDKFRMKQ
jgi:hypothetical protein